MTALWNLVTDVTNGPNARLQAGFTRFEPDWIDEIEQTLKSYINK